MISLKVAIQNLKANSFDEASSRSIFICNSNKKIIGKLLPVGDWILADREKIELMRDWRQKTMRMFLTQFQSTYERTYSYLKNISIGQDSRILFLLYDEQERFVGHVGIADIDGNGGELDNLMRGVEGGDPRLIYFSEITLLNWCFTQLGLRQSKVGVLSYNWMAISLHGEVGYTVSEQISLHKSEKDGVILHDVSSKCDSNVKYAYIKMLLMKDDFYRRATWLAL